MANLAKAVQLTRRYASFFSYPLTDETLFRFLISDRQHSRTNLKSYFLDLQPDEKRLLAKRLQISQIKLQKALSLVRLLSFVPTISFIAATGSLAVNNARTDDDIDLMVVVSSDTLWLTRPLVVVLLKLLHLRRPSSLSQQHSPAVTNKVCDNLWLDETALALPFNKRNLYTAHEVLQVLPLFDRGDVYQRFIQANTWTAKYLANAYQYANSNFPSPLAGEGGTAPAGGEGSGRASALRAPNRLVSLIRALNWMAFKLQYLYMQKKITHETVTVHAAYFHPRNLASELEKHLRQGK